MRKEIVAVKLGDTLLSTDPVAIMEAAEKGGIPLHYMTRSVFKELARIEFDAALKRQWQKIAQGPALFFIEDDGSMTGASMFSIRR